MPISSARGSGAAGHGLASAVANVGAGKRDDMGGSVIQLSRDSAVFAGEKR
jgi:hypothetical protein